MRRSPVGVEQKPLHDQDVNAFTVILIAWKDLRIQRVVDAVGSLELDGVLLPGVDGAHHGVHVQSADDCGGNEAKVSGAEHQTCINTHANPWIRARLTIILLKAIFTNFNLILGLKHTPMRRSPEHGAPSHR